jgi:cell division protein FtsZ
LIQISDEDTPLQDAFRLADEVLLQGVSGITDLITTPGLINLDFADVRTIMTDAGSALMGIGEASGDNRATEAGRLAVSSPLLEASIEGARGLIINISGGPDLRLIEVSEATDAITSAAHPEANVIFGAAIDESLGGKVRVTVLAAGFEGREWQEPVRQERPAAADSIFGDEEEEGEGTFEDDELEIPDFLRT